MQAVHRFLLFNFMSQAIVWNLILIYISHLTKRLVMKSVWISHIRGPMTARRGHGNAILPNCPHRAEDPATPMYRTKGKPLEPLTVNYRSLHENQEEEIDENFLEWFIRRVHILGLTLVKVDIRQKADGYKNALYFIIKYVEIDSYCDFDERERLGILISILEGTGPLVSHSHTTTDEAKMVLDTFQAIPKSVLKP